MQERSFGERSAYRVPRANIGGMRLPEDMDEAAALIRHAIESGMRYIDTSRGYGDSELRFAKALKGGYRDKVILSTKYGPWSLKPEELDGGTVADFIRREIDVQLGRLEVEYVDFYQPWSINNQEHYDTMMKKGRILEGIRRAMDEGLVRHTGFTTHASVEDLLEWIPQTDWAEVILFTYNVLNTRYAPAITCAHEHGIGTIVMNPVGGGKLAASSPVLLGLAQEVAARSPAEMAIRWLITNDHVDTIISGITKPSDVDDTIAAVEAGPFSDDQRAVIKAFQDKVAPEETGFCTGCRYCMPCPQEVNIPAIMSCIYEDRYWGLTDWATKRYQGMKAGKADACVQCGECEDKCTQDLEIMKELAYANEKYAES